MHLTNSKHPQADNFFWTTKACNSCYKTLLINHLFFLF